MYYKELKDYYKNLKYNVHKLTKEKEDYKKQIEDKIKYIDELTNDLKEEEEHKNLLNERLNNINNEIAMLKIDTQEYENVYNFEDEVLKLLKKGVSYYFNREYNIFHTFSRFQPNNVTNHNEIIELMKKYKIVYFTAKVSGPYDRSYTIETREEIKI